MLAVLTLVAFLFTALVPAIPIFADTGSPHENTKSTKSISIMNNQQIAKTKTVKLKNKIKYDPIKIDKYTYASTNDNTENLFEPKWVTYISGYPDKTVKPNNNITRAEAIAMIVRLYDKEYPKNKEVWTNKTFLDVPIKEWYFSEVKKAFELGLIKGTDNKKLEPNKPITRAELTAIANRFMSTGQPATEDEIDFIDTDEADWFYKDVKKATKKGWVSGNPDGTFKPNDPITRAETAVILNRVLTRQPDSQKTLAMARENKFKDLKDEDWFYGDLLEASICYWRLLNVNPYKDADINKVTEQYVDGKQIIHEDNVTKVPLPKKKPYIPGFTYIGYQQVLTHNYVPAKEQKPSTPDKKDNKDKGGDKQDYKYNKSRDEDTHKFKDVYEDGEYKQLNKKPEGYSMVNVDPGEFADTTKPNGTPRIFWVNPNHKVKVPAKNPTPIESFKFDGWDEEYPVVDGYFYYHFKNPVYNIYAKYTEIGQPPTPPDPPNPPTPPTPPDPPTPPTPPTPPNPPKPPEKEKIELTIDEHTCMNGSSGIAISSNQEGTNLKIEITKKDGEKETYETITWGPTSRLIMNLYKPLEDGERITITGTKEGFDSEQIEITVKDFDFTVLPLKSSDKKIRILCTDGVVLSTMIKENGRPPFDRMTSLEGEDTYAANLPFEIYGGQRLVVGVYLDGGGMKNKEIVVPIDPTKDSAKLELDPLYEGDTVITCIPTPKVVTVESFNEDMTRIYGQVQTYAGPPKWGVSIVDYGGRPAKLGDTYKVRARGSGLNATEYTVPVLPKPQPKETTLDILEPIKEGINKVSVSTNAPNANVTIKVESTDGTSKTFNGTTDNSGNLTQSLASYKLNTNDKITATVSKEGYKDISKTVTVPERLNLDLADIKSTDKVLTVTGEPGTKLSVKVGDSYLLLGTNKIPDSGELKIVLSKELGYSKAVQVEGTLPGKSDNSVSKTTEAEPKNMSLKFNPIPKLGDKTIGVKSDAAQAKVVFSINGTDSETSTDNTGVSSISLPAKLKAGDTIKVTASKIGYKDKKIEYKIPDKLQLSVEQPIIDTNYLVIESTSGTFLTATLNGNPITLKYLSGNKYELPSKVNPSDEFTVVGKKEGYSDNQATVKAPAERKDTLNVTFNQSTIIEGSKIVEFTTTPDNVDCVFYTRNGEVVSNRNETNSGNSGKVHVTLSEKLKEGETVTVTAYKPGYVSKMFNTTVPRNPDLHKDLKMSFAKQPKAGNSVIYINIAEPNARLVIKYDGRAVVEEPSKNGQIVPIGIGVTMAAGKEISVTAYKEGFETKTITAIVAEPEKPKVESKINLMAKDNKYLKTMDIAGTIEGFPKNAKVTIEVVPNGKSKGDATNPKFEVNADDSGAVSLPGKIQNLLPLPELWASAVDVNNEKVEAKIPYSKAPVFNIYTQNNAYGKGYVEVKPELNNAILTIVIKDKDGNKVSEYVTPQLPNDRFTVIDLFDGSGNPYEITDGTTIEYYGEAVKDGETWFAAPRVEKFHAVKPPFDTIKLTVKNLSEGTSELNYVTDPTETQISIKINKKDGTVENYTGDTYNTNAEGNGKAALKSKLALGDKIEFTVVKVHQGKSYQGVFSFDVKKREVVEPGESETPKADIEVKDDDTLDYLDISGTLTNIPNDAYVYVEVDSTGNGQGADGNTSAEIEVDANGQIRPKGKVERPDRDASVWIVIEEKNGKKWTIKVPYNRIEVLALTVSSPKEFNSEVLVKTKKDSTVQVLVTDSGKNKVATGKGTITNATDYNSIPLVTEAGAPYKLKNGDIVTVRATYSQNNYSKPISYTVEKSASQGIQPSRDTFIGVSKYLNVNAVVVTEKEYNGLKALMAGQNSDTTKLAPIGASGLLFNTNLPYGEAKGLLVSTDQPNANVSISLDNGTASTGQTDANGVLFKPFSGDVSEIKVSATKEGFKAGSVRMTVGKTGYNKLSVNLRGLMDNSSTFKILTNAPGASVDVYIDENKVDTITTDGNGEYSYKNHSSILGGQVIKLVATKSGYRTATYQEIALVDPTEEFDTLSVNVPDVYEGTKSFPFYVDKTGVRASVYLNGKLVLDNDEIKTSNYFGFTLTRLPDVLEKGDTVKLVVNKPGYNDVVQEVIVKENPKINPVDFGLSSNGPGSREFEVLPGEDGLRVQIYDGDKEVVDRQLTKENRFTITLNDEVYIENLKIKVSKEGCKTVTKDVLRRN